MFKLSPGRDGKAVYSTVIIAFDRSSGRVHGTFIHNAFTENDQAGVARSRKQFLGDLRGRFSGNVELDALELPNAESLTGSIESIDLATRQVVRKEIEPSTGVRKP